MTTATSFDWTTAQKTTGAQNVRPEQVAQLAKVVQVPRAVFDKYWPLPWSQVEAAAFAGTDGVAPCLIWGNDRAPVDTAYLHHHGRPERTCLYSQGW